MSLVQIILVVIVAFIIGCSSVNDQIETYQPVVACSLIGLVTGHLELGVMLGGSLQLITMGWANVGAAMAPDASLAAVASTIILILGGQGTKDWSCHRPCGAFGCCRSCLDNGCPYSNCLHRSYYG